MKKILIAACMLFCVSGVYAQIKVGAKAGLNLSTLTEDGAKMKVGFHVGGFAEFAINDRFAIQPELLYSTQGAKGDLVDEGVALDGTIALDYINVPVLLKINIAEGLSAEIGPQVGFLLAAKAKVEVQGASGEADIKSACKTLDVSAVAGLSYTFAEKFVAGARYGLGLTTIYKGGVKSNNGVISLSIGYKF